MRGEGGIEGRAKRRRSCSSYRAAFVHEMRPGLNGRRLLDVSRSIDAEIFHGLCSILQHEARYPLAEVVWFSLGILFDSE